MTHEHLSDEQLSAHLDGETADGPAAAVTAQGTVEEQVAGCPTCRERLVALSRVQALVRLPVDPVLPSMRATAVASALAEAAGAAQSEPGPVATPSDLPDGRGRQPSSLPVWVGAAAAVILVVVGLSLGLSQRGNGPTATSAAAPPTTSLSSRASAGSSTHAPSASGQPTPTALSLPAGSVADLGSLSSVGALKAGVSRALASSTESEKSASAPNTATAAPGNASAQAPGFEAVTSVPAALSMCVSAAQRAAGTTGTLELVATATYGHTPALVVVVDVTDPSSTGRLAVAVARSGCRVLARTGV